MINRTYLSCWLSGVRCRAAGCASRKSDVARLALSSGWGGGWTVGTEGSGRLRIVQERAFLSGEELDVELFIGG